MTDHLGTDKVQFERIGTIALVTINRPEARNAVDSEVAAGLEAAFTLIDGDPGIAVSILTGAGGTFCAGADLKAMSEGRGLPVTEAGGFGGITRRPPETPVIAAVEGFAVAGGLELLLACDLIVAADDAKFGLPEVKHGLAAAAGGLLRLPRRIPFHVAMELTLTGDPIPAERAHALGLVNQLTGPGGAMDAALKLAERIARNGPLALRASKQVLRRQADWTEEQGWDAQDAYIGPVFASDDAKEGPRAFAEKRPPVWSGR